MSDQRDEGEAHVNDGTLLRLFDGQLDDTERRATESHLLACPICAREFSALRGMSDAVHRAVAAQFPDVQPPAWHAPSAALDHRRSRLIRRLSLAAGIVIVVTIGAASPLRAYVEAIIARVTGRPAPSAEVTRTIAPPVTRVAPERVAVEFTPDSPDLVVNFRASQPRGTIEVRTHALGAVVLYAPSGSREEVVVLPSGVRVQNVETDSNTYKLLVPETMRSVVVNVAGRRVLSAAAESLARGPMHLQLGARR